MANSTQVRAAGYTTSTQKANTTISGNRTAFTLSNGNALVVISDPNAASSANGDKTGTTKIYVYESSDRINWTLRATTTPPITGYTWTAALYNDNSVGIMISADTFSTTGTRFIKMTYAGYALSAWETITTTFFSGFSELAITDTDLPIAVITTISSDNTTSRHEVWIRLASAVWTLVTTFGSVTSVFNASWSASITALGVTAGVRRMAVCTSGVFIGDDGANVRIFKVTESTGALSGTVTIAGTYATNETDHFNTSGRVAKLFRSATDEWTLGLMHLGKNRSYGFVRGTYDGTTSTITVPYTSANSGLLDLGFRSAGITYGNDCLNFVYTAANVSGEAKAMLVNYTGKIIRSDGNATYIGGYYMLDDYNSAYTTWYVSSGGDKNVTATSRFDTLMIEGSSTTNHLARHIYTNLSTIVMTTLYPAAGSTATSSNPPLGISVACGLKYFYSRVRIKWQFAKDAGFTTNYIEQLGADVSLWAKSINGTQSGATIRFTDALGTLYRLAQGTWYVRACVVDTFGNNSANTAAQLFTVSHPPTAGNLVPSSGKVVAWATGIATLTWQFNDTSATDKGTAWQVVTERVDTGAVLVDSGKVVNAGNVSMPMLAAGAKDIPLRWKVRVWDTDDVVGPYSDYATFQMSDPATIVFVSPVNNSAVNSSRPQVTFTPTVSGGRTITSYQVSITQGNNLIWTSGPVTGVFTSGTPITVSSTKSYLVNGNAYTVQANVTDSLGLVGYATPITITTFWIPPAPPAGVVADASQFDVEDKGYISLVWDDTARDVDFDSWVVYRKDDLIDPSTGAVAVAGTWAEVSRYYTIATSYEHRDVLAPSNYKINYRVTQNVNRQGDQVESINTDAYICYPVSASYWLVHPPTIYVGATGIRFPLVTGDSFTDEYETEEYLVVGRGRHVDIGEHLGYKGSLDVRIRNTGGVLARVKRQQLMALKDMSTIVYLRNPFGDSFKVNVEDIGVSRIAGVGRDEFCDVTIPYGQVN